MWHVSIYMSILGTQASYNPWQHRSYIMMYAPLLYQSYHSLCGCFFSKVNVALQVKSHKDLVHFETAYVVKLHSVARLAPTQPVSSLYPNGMCDFMIRNHLLFLFVTVVWFVSFNLSFHFLIVITVLNMWLGLHIYPPRPLTSEK